MKYCKDCKWVSLPSYVSASFETYCTHPELLTEDPVRGKLLARARGMRESAACCGLEGKRFEPKATAAEKFRRWWSQ